MIVRPTRRDVLRFGAAAGAAMLPAPAIAQAWPSKPIKIVCTYPPGGLTDIYSRARLWRVCRAEARPVGGGREQDRRGGRDWRRAREECAARWLHADVH